MYFPPGLVKEKALASCSMQVILTSYEIQEVKVRLSILLDVILGRMIGTLNNYNYYIAITILQYIL